MCYTFSHVLVLSDLRNDVRQNLIPRTRYLGLWRGISAGRRCVCIRLRGAAVSCSVAFSGTAGSALARPAAALRLPPQCGLASAPGRAWSLGWKSYCVSWRAESKCFSFKSTGHKLYSPSPQVGRFGPQPECSGPLLSTGGRGADLLFEMVFKEPLPGNGWHNLVLR